MPKSRSQIFQDAWVKMHQIEWLFPQNFEMTNAKGEEHLGPISSEEYIAEFARKRQLFMLRAPTPYSFGFLEKYKEKIVFSAHIANSGTIIPYTIFQLEGAKSHIICDWLWDAKDSEFLFPATFFVTDQRDYGKLMVENRQYEIELKEEGSLGFGSHDV